MPDWVDHAVRYWQACGPLGMALTLACFAIWFYFWRSRAMLRGLLAGVRALIPALPRAVAGETTDDPADRYTDFLHRLLARVMTDVRAGRPLGESFDLRLDPLFLQARRDLVILSALTIVAPLLGLFGTVLGMIDTFQAVGGGGVTDRMAAGISQALITTEFGLVVAIPGLFGMARLHRLVAHLRARMAICRTRLIMAWELQPERL